MIDRVRDYGITVGEIPANDGAINWPGTTRPAFIGRALRGPLDTPVLIDSAAAYKRRFGGPWHKSALSQAVEQFFSHGGKELYVVRVANDATGAQLELPGPAGPLNLAAAEPGSTEMLRAAVDYDGVEDDEHFNLVLQRLAPQSGLVIDQEIHAGVSVFADSPDFLGDALTGSSLAMLERPLPPARPYATMGRHAQARAPYVMPTARGRDGSELTDYDLIGCRERRTGLFSLETVDDFDLMYLPPPAPDREPGPAALLAAEAYCRRRGAMLITDPSGRWEDAIDAAAGVRHAGLSSSSVMTYFPRLAIGSDTYPAGGALAGLLCRLDAEEGPWGSLANKRYAFTRGTRPACEMTEADRQLLIRTGINPVTRGRDGRFEVTGHVTLARTEQTDPFHTDLSVRRLCLKLAKTIEQASRWALFEAKHVHAATEVQQQVASLLESLEAKGALARGESRASCESRHTSDRSTNGHSLIMLLTLRPAGTACPLSITLYHTPAGCRIASTAFAPVSAQATAVNAA